MTVHESKYHLSGIQIHQRSLTSCVSSRNIDRGRDGSGGADRRNVDDGCRVGDSSQVTSGG
jgi:hypothetical protein